MTTGRINQGARHFVLEARAPYAVTGRPARLLPGVSSRRAGRARLLLHRAGEAFPSASRLSRRPVGDVSHPDVSPACSICKYGRRSRRLALGLSLGLGVFVKNVAAGRACPPPGLSR